MLGGGWPTCSDTRRMSCSARAVLGRLVPGAESPNRGWLLAAARRRASARDRLAAALSISYTFAEGAERNRALGIWARWSAPGRPRRAARGNPTSGLNWRWECVLQRPIGIAAAGSPRTLVESAEDGASTFDFPGAITVTAGCRWSSTRSSTPSTSAGDLEDAARDRRRRDLLVAFPDNRAPPANRYAVLDLPATDLRAPTSSACCSHVAFSMFFFISLYSERATTRDQDGIRTAARDRDHHLGGLLQWSADRFKRR